MSHSLLANAGRLNNKFDTDTMAVQLISKKTRACSCVEKTHGRDLRFVVDYDSFDFLSVRAN